MGKGLLDSIIEIPKLQENSDEKNMLVAWTEFLKNPESEKVRSLEMDIKEIREAKDELIKMSNNSEQRQLYEMRANTLRDKISALNKAKEEGKEEGDINRAKIGIRNMLSKGMSTELIAELLEVPIELVQEVEGE